MKKHGSGEKWKTGSERSPPERRELSAVRNDLIYARLADMANWREKMKVGMKRLTLISIPVFALALAIALGSTLAEPAPVHGYTDVQADETGTNFEGVVTLFIGNVQLEGTVIGVNEGGMEERGNVIHLPDVTIVFTFEGGTITTMGDTFLTPTNEPGVYNTSGLMKITGGTGDFDGARGQLAGHGYYDWNSGYGHSNWNGVICCF